MDFQKQRSQLEQKFLALSENIVKDNGLELYDLEYLSGQSLLRVYIIDPKTKSAELDDCVKVDRAFSEPCETLDWIPDSLVLEVSSPGVYRNLKSLDHFKEAQGELISCTLSQEIGEREGLDLSKAMKKAKKIRGKLIKTLDENILIELDNQEVEINFSQIKKANLDPEL